MGKFQLNLSNFKRGEGYRFSRKIVLNQIIQDKNFTELIFVHVKFFNSSFKSISFDASEQYSLKFSNCQLNNIRFNAADLMNFEFEKCQLINVSFDGSQVDNLTIKNCLLKDIDCSYIIVFKTVSENGIVTTESILIEDYDSFLTEFVK